MIFLWFVLLGMIITYNDSSILFLLLRTKTLHIINTCQFLIADLLCNSQKMYIGKTKTIMVTCVFVHKTTLKKWNDWVHTLPHGPLWHLCTHECRPQLISLPHVSPQVGISSVHGKSYTEIYMYQLTRYIHVSLQVGISPVHGKSYTEIYMYQLTRYIHVAQQYISCSFVDWFLLLYNFKYSMYIFDSTYEWYSMSIFVSKFSQSNLVELLYQVTRLDSFLDSLRLLFIGILSPRHKYWMNYDTKRSWQETNAIRLYKRNPIVKELGHTVKTKASSWC